MKNKKFPNFENDAAFDEFLLTRVQPPVSPDLHNQIMRRILRTEQQRSRFDFKNWLEELWADFMPLRPAYALASVLLAGFLFGAVVVPMITSEDNHPPPMLLADEGDMP
jgi:hypothetical protein